MHEFIFNIHFLSWFIIHEQSRLPSNSNIYTRKSNDSSYIILFYVI